MDTAGICKGVFLVGVSLKIWCRSCSTLACCLQVCFHLSFFYLLAVEVQIHNFTSLCAVSLLNQQFQVRVVECLEIKWDEIRDIARWLDAFSHTM